MAKKSKKQELHTYFVPMTWEFRGGAFVEAFTEEEAVEKAEGGKFNDGVELHESGAELINWEVTGDAELND